MGSEISDLIEGLVGRSVIIWDSFMGEKALRDFVP